ncbi:MAG: GNAT family N-acetyltransferase [Gemmatimonadota bacterium]
MTVGVLYEEMHRPPRRPERLAVLDAVDATEGALAGFGHRVLRLPVRASDFEWLERLRSADLDLIFNLCEGVDGDGIGEFRVSAAAELLGIPMTGCSADVLSFALRKDRVNGLLVGRRLPIPPYTLVELGRVSLEWSHFPAIVKPAAQDGSLGIDEQAVVQTPAELRAKIDELLPIFELLLVQRFVEGREFNVGFVGTSRLPLAEIDFASMPDGMARIVSYSAKWESGSPADRGTIPICPAEVEPELEARIVEVAERAWLAVSSGSGYGRVDVRLDVHGRPYVLEVNPNPDLTPQAGLARMAGVAGLDYPALVAAVCREAFGGAANDEGRDKEPAPEPQRRRAGTVTLAAVEASHRERIRQILEDTGVFRYDEVNVALEVLDVYLSQAGQTDYYIIGAFSEKGELVGYACYGPTPCTVGTWDLYWIAVDPTHHGQGVGRRLLNRVESEIAARDGRMILAETSSQPSYRPTREFYAHRGYEMVSRVMDFYAPGDDRMIFAKRLSGPFGGAGSDE